MREEVLARLRPITAEEEELLEGNHDIRRERYTDRREFVVDCQRMLEKGKLIDLRIHTRFAHFPRHRHNYVEMVYMCAGQTTHIINGQEKITLEEGDLLFLNPSVYHEILPAQQGDIAANFIILPEFFDRTMVMLEQENLLRSFLTSALFGPGDSGSYLHLHGKGIVPVENILESMIWTLLENKSGTNTVNATSMGLLFLNLSLFVDSLQPTSSHQDWQDTVFAVLKYIESHYKSGTLSEVSALLGQPTYGVSRLLKKHTGSNFKQLLQQRKLQQAAYLLTNTPSSVDVILSSIGYDNSCYFYRKFRDKYGCSPAEYREKNSLVLGGHPGT